MAVTSPRQRRVKANHKEEGDTIEEFISCSRFNCYLSCPRKHWYRYTQKIRKTVKNRPLTFGTDFHKLLELRKSKKAVKAELNRIKDEFYELPANQQSELGDSYPDDLRSIFEDYMEVWKGTPIPAVTEKKFELPLMKQGETDVYFVGVIDELYYDFNSPGKLVIGEHKTFSRKPDAQALVMNTQKCLYAKAVFFITGELPHEVMWDYIRSTPADPPIWLPTSKRFSTAKTTKVTPYSYKRACDELGIDDESIRVLGGNYTPNTAEFFFRRFQDFIPEMVDDVFDGFKYTAADIITQGKTNKTRNLSRDCSFCDYNDICYTELTGGNVEYLFESGLFQVEEGDSE